MLLHPASRLLGVEDVVVFPVAVNGEHGAHTALNVDVVQLHLEVQAQFQQMLVPVDVVFQLKVCERQSTVSARPRDLNQRFAYSYISVLYLYHTIITHEQWTSAARVTPLECILLKVPGSILM